MQVIDVRKIRDNKYVFWSGIVLLLAFLASKASHEGDFKVFLEAAKTMHAHESMYDVWLNHLCCKYFYSPLFSLILIPFTYIPYYVVNFLWLCADIYFLVRIWKFISSKIDVSAFTVKEHNIFLLLVFLLSIRFLLLNFDMVQMTIFLLWAMLESLDLFERKKNVQGAVLLAFVINIKLMPIAMIPYLLLRRKFIPVLWVVLFSIVMLFIPAIFLGTDFNNYLLSEWFRNVNPASTEHNVDTSLGAQSLNSWLIPLLMNTTGEIDFKRNIANLNLSTINWIVNITRVLFIGFTLYFTGLTFFKQAKSKLRMLWELGYLFLIIPLVFPHQQKYEFFLSFPAVVYLCYFVMSNYHSGKKLVPTGRWKTILVLLAFSFVLNTLTTDMLIGYYLGNITQHYKAITYGTILLVIAYTLSNPRYLETNIAAEENRA